MILVLLQLEGIVREGERGNRKEGTGNRLQLADCRCRLQIADWSLELGVAETQREVSLFVRFWVMMLPCDESFLPT
jgi:hypothetical protein